MGLVVPQDVKPRKTNALRKGEAKVPLEGNPRLDLGFSWGILGFTLVSQLDGKQLEGHLRMKPKTPKSKPKWRDPTWRVRLGLSHKVVPSKKIYRRRPKHGKEQD